MNISIQGRAARTAIRAVGVLAIFSALIGLCYNFVGLAVSFTSTYGARIANLDEPYFFPAFYSMSAICIGCYLLLIAFGVQLFRYQTARLKGFTTLLIFEVVYIFLVDILWQVPEIGRSVAAATGVANGGLTLQGIIFFPLWAPPVAFWARKQLPALPEAIHQ